MINSTPVNNSSVNSRSKFSGLITDINSSNIFSTLLTKYGFKTIDGTYFNFNSLELKQSNHGNTMDSHNFDDVPDIEVTKYGNALQNGGVIYDRRYKEKTFDITLTFISDKLETLEKEINNLKSYLELGGYCYKAEKKSILKIAVKLTNFTVSRLLVKGTTINIQLLTMDPFWSATSAITIINEGNIGSFTGSIILKNTKMRGFVKHTIYLRTITGTINQLTLTIGGYPIIINKTLVSGDTIVLDGINNEGSFNGDIVKYLGQFPELEINTTYTLTVTFAGGGTVSSFDLYNIYDNKQL